MPKRRNPFGESSPLQFKQHVGVKEVDLGVAQEQKMKSVYAKTRDLLFSGSKRSFDVAKDANCNDLYQKQMESDIAMEDEMSQCPRQMILTNTGELATPHTQARPQNASQALMMAKQSFTLSSCQCCKGQAASQDRCAFCEKAVCYDCVRPCSACANNFCQLCAVMNPDDAVQQWYCQQCSYRLNPYIYWTQAY